MEERTPRWVYVVIIALIAVVAVLGWKTFVGTKDDRGSAPTPEQGARQDRQSQGLDSELAQLRRELEANADRVKALEARLDETNRALAATQERLKMAQKQAERPPAAPAPVKEKAVAKSAEPGWRRPAEPGRYEVIRATTVFERPSASSREVTTVTKGTVVNVVGSQGEWLEVRSKQGRPPGFIRRDDAMFREGPSDIK